MSKGTPSVWGLPQVVKWVKSDALKEIIGSDLSIFTAVSQNKDCAISILIPTCFHKSLYGKIGSQVYLNMDVVVQESSYEEARLAFIDVLKEETKNSPTYLVLGLHIVADKQYAFTGCDLMDGILDSDVLFSKLLPTISSLYIDFMFIKDGGDVFCGKKYCTFYHVRKKIGKFLSTAYCNPPLLNLFTGVLISGAELYETCLFQSLYLHKEQVKGGKEVKVQLGPSLPLVKASVEQYIAKFLKTEKHLDFFRYLDGLVVQHFFVNDESSEDELLNELFWVHRGASKFIHDVIDMCSLVERLIILHQDDEDNAPLHIIVIAVDNLFKLFEQPLPLKFLKSVLHRRFFDFLSKASKLKVLRDLFDSDDEAGFSNFQELVAINKMSCVVCFLYFLTPALANLPLINNLLTQEGSDAIVPNGHSFNDQPTINTVCTIPSKPLSLSFHNTLMDAPHHFGIDVKKSSGQIQSAPNMHTVSVLLKYQNDLLLDTSLEQVISSATASLEENPYNEFVSEFMNMSFKVEMDCVSEASIHSMMLKRPKLVDSDNQIFTVSDQNSQVFGLCHALSPLDLEGSEYVLSICDLVMNKPKITKKHGVRVRPVVIPTPKMVLVGQLCPVIYNFSCEELYVLIKEKTTATADIAVGYLSEIVVDHLVELSIIAEVTAIIVNYEQQRSISLKELTQNRDSLIEFLKDTFTEQSIVTIEFFLLYGNSYYIKVVKDLRPIYVDKTNDAVEVLTAVSAENSFFPIFSKLYQAKFFYDYDEILEKSDLKFIINRLNKCIIDNQDAWDVYLDIQLKKMLTQDNNFLLTAYKSSHSHSYKLNSLQNYNALISDIIKQVLQKPGNLINKEVVKSMTCGFCSAFVDCIEKASVPYSVKLLLHIDLNFIYNDGDPMLDVATVDSLRNLWICSATLCEVYKRVMFTCLPAIQSEIAIAVTEASQYFDI